MDYALTLGYRRVWGLLRRAREKQSLATNVKRVYRFMRDHNLLVERRLKHPSAPRRHEGRIAVQTSDTRWCSDGFEFRCDDGAKLSVTIALDCCDREAIGWVASPTEYGGVDTFPHAHASPVGHQGHPCRGRPVRSKREKQ